MNKDALSNGGRTERLREETKYRDWKIKIAGVLLAGLIATQAVVFLMSVFPVRVVSLHSLTVVVIDTISENPTITLELEYTKHKAVAGEYIIQLSNHHNLVFPPVQSNVEATRQRKSMRMILDLPTPVPNGEYVAIFTARYQPNAFRAESFTVKSEPFLMR